ncbi:MAG: hypothetical protein JSV00_04165 [bacterium]|nr:MAG: hypothetical protein JSV00_04165 [bacterium]
MKTIEADMMMKRSTLRTLLLHTITVAVTVAVTVTVPAVPSHACVGRKLILGSVQTGRADMASRLLSILINERTGTTVEVKFFEDAAGLLDAVGKGKVDLYVDHVDNALIRMGRSGDSESLGGEERFKLVKRLFDEELNLIWLKPMGYSGRDAGGASLGPAAVVVKKDTLKKFPALPRLLEKIGTRVPLDDDRLDDLVKRAQSEKPARVARDFLKEVKLI